MEHYAHPLRELQALLPKLLPGALTVVFYVLCEAIKNKFRQGDPNHHLYTWNPISAANLFVETGFTVVESKAYLHTWPPRFLPLILRNSGCRRLLELDCTLYRTLTHVNLTPTDVSQVRVVAKRLLNP